MPLPSKIIFSDIATNLSIAVRLAKPKFQTFPDISCNFQQFYVVNWAQPYIFGEKSLSLLGELVFIHIFEEK